MAAYKVLYNNVYEALKASSIIKTVEDFNEQYDNLDKNNLIKYPACFIETGTVIWDKNETKYYELSHENQTGTAEIKIHVVYHTLNGFDKETKNKFFDIVDHVTNILQKNQSGNVDVGTYSTLLRTNEEYLFNNRQLRVAILTFETKLKDVFPERTDYITETITVTFNNDYNV